MKNLFLPSAFRLGVLVEPSSSSWHDDGLKIGEFACEFTDLREIGAEIDSRRGLDDASSGSRSSAGAVECANNVENRED